MGLFFEDKKPPEPPPQVTQEVQGWPITLLVLILTGIGVALGWALKPLLTYLFTFEDRTRKQVGAQILIIIVLLLGGVALLYQISFIRHLTIKTTHTLNHSRYGGRIAFPSSEYFTSEGSSRNVPFNNKIYITFAGYTKNVIQKINQNHCQMVQNWERLGLSSTNPPVAAEGFADEVRYTVVQNVSSLTGFSYLRERIMRPSYWFDGEGLAYITVEREKSEPWKRFIDDWNLIWKFESGHRVFEVRSLWNENAVICF